MAKVTQIIDGDTSGLVAALANVEKRLDGVDAKLQRTKATAEKPLRTGLEASAVSANKMAGEIGNFASGLAMSLASAFSLKTVLGEIVGLNMKWADSLSAVDEKMELAQIRLQIQTGEGGPAVKQSIMRAIGAARDTPSVASIAEATQIQTFLESSTLEKGDVKSGLMAKKILEMKAALNAFGEGGELSSMQATKLASGAVSGFGLAGTAANLERISITMANAFKETAMTGGDVPELLGKAPALQRFGITPEQAFGAFAPMVSANIPASTAATGLAAYSSFLADVKPNQERDEALASVNLTREAIAPRVGGPTLFESLDKVAKALEGKDEITRNQFFANVFGRENAAPIAMMLQKREEMAALGGKFDDRTAYDTAVKTFRESDFARSQGMRIAKESSEYTALQQAGGVSWKNVEEALEARFAHKRQMAEQAGASTIPIGLEEAHAKFQLFSAKAAGQTPKGAVESGVFVAEKEVTTLIQQLIDATKENGAAIRDGKVNRNGGVEVPAVTPNF